MKAKSKLKQFEKVLIFKKQKPLFIFVELVNGSDSGLEPGKPVEERQRVLRHRFLNSENSIDVLTEYFKTEGIIFPVQDVYVFHCDYEKITLNGMVVPYTELEPFMAPE